LKVQISFGGGGGTTRPLPRDGAWRNSTETQKSGHAPRSGPRSKMEEVVPKMARRRLGCGTVKEEVSQILQRVSWGLCMKNSPSVLSCIGRTREDCDRGSEIGAVHRE